MDCAGGAVMRAVYPLSMAAFIAVALVAGPSGWLSWTLLGMLALILILQVAAEIAGRHGL